MQPHMFTSGFVYQVIAPAAQGEPGFVAALVHLGSRLFLLNPALFNLGFALIQLIIGGLILFRATAKVGLVLSLVWGLVVWSLGEAFGGIFSTHTLLLMGAPGAVALYMLIALAIMPALRGAKKLNHPKYWLVFVWMILWIGGGVYQLLPGQNTAAGLGSMIAGNASGAPGWLASLDTSVGNWLAGFSGVHAAVAASPNVMTMGGMVMSSPLPQSPTHPGYAAVLILALIEVAIGMGVLLPGWWRRSAVGLGMVLSLLFWIVGQDMGAIYSGFATDLNSGPLFMLLGLAVLSVDGLDHQLRILGSRIESLLIGQPDQQNALVVQPADENRLIS